MEARRRARGLEIPDAGAPNWIINTASYEQKLLLMARLWRGHLQRVRAAVARDHPGWCESRRQVEVARRVSGNDPAVIAAARQRYEQASGTE